MAKIPGLPVAFIVVGGVLVWSGVENEPVTSVLRSLASGQAPGKGPAETFATPEASTLGEPGVPGGAGSLGTGSGAQLAALAMNYAGHCYSFGGAPGTSGTGCWDCSSFMNWVVGHDAQLAIPGYGAGKYTGATHGPSSGVWLLWGGAKTISAASAQAGDLVVSVGHMGMITTPGNYVSAHDPAEATSVSPVSSFPFTEGPMFYRRLIAVETADASPGQTLPDVLAHAGSG